MVQDIIPKGNHFLVGLGVASLIGVLLAPKSGEETRKYLAKKSSEGNEFARKQA
jgi:gas vesicle protein